MKKIFLSVLPALLAAVSALFSYSSLGAQELIVFESPNLACNDSVLVYSPRGNSAPAPALFLLHGWSGDYRNWSEKYDLQQLSDRTGFRIICPDGFYNSWYLDSSDPSGMQWRKFFHQELYPALQEKYGLSPDSTFITGLSMGGHGAINIFLDDTTRFKTAGSMSGVLDLQLTPLKEKQISKIIGEHRERLALESAVNRVEKLSGRKTPLIISCGYDDYYAICAEAFVKKCKAVGVPYIELSSPGNHSWTYWTFALEQHLQLFGKIMNGENLGY